MTVLERELTSKTSNSPKSITLTYLDDFVFVLEEAT